MDKKVSGNGVGEAFMFFGEKSTRFLSESIIYILIIMAFQG